MEEDLTYKSWENMLATVRQSGAKIDERWKNFYFEFKKDMGKREIDLVLCRRDWNRGFNKENCFWGTPEEARHAQMITWQDRCMSIRDWAVETGLSWRTIYYRLHAGWEIEDVLFWPAQGKVKADV